MKCPACNNELTKYDAGGVEVDICRDHCGGIWFDDGEFQHYDEAHESAPQVLLQVIRNATVVIDRNKARPCPRCDGQTLTKRFYDEAREMQIDQCPSCAGVWLDPGELEVIRDENEGSVDRTFVIDSFYRNATSGNVPPEHQKRIKAVLGLLFK